MGNQLTIEHHRSTVSAGGVEVTLCVSGALIAATIERLRDEVQKIIDRQPHALILDVSNVTQVDANGLSVLTTTYRKSASRQIDFMLLNPAKPLLTLLEMTRLVEIFNFRS